jgi:hypothetical protein
MQKMSWRSNSLRFLSRKQIGAIAYDICHIVLKKNSLKEKIYYNQVVTYILKNNEVAKELYTIGSKEMGGNYAPNTIIQDIVIHLLNTQVLKYSQEDTNDLVLENSYMHQLQISLAVFSPCEICGDSSEKLLIRPIGVNQAVQLPICNLCYEYINLLNCFKNPKTILSLLKRLNPVLSEIAKHKILDIHRLTHGK